jgi:type IV pilus assembly protein PilB
MDYLDILIQHGFLKEADISELNRRAKKDFDGDIDSAVLSFRVPEKALLEAKSQQYDIPFKEIDEKGVPFDVLKMIPEDSARHYKFIPIGIVDKVLEIGVVEPQNTATIDAVEFIASKINIPYRIYIISSVTYKKLLEGYKGMTGIVSSALNEFDNELGDTVEIPQVSSEVVNEESLVEEAPIIKIVAVIINHATEGDASDIHIESTGDKVKVRFRVDGVLHTSLVLPMNVYSGVVARIKILAKLKLDEKRKPQDGSFSAKVGGRKVDFRVSTFPTAYGEKVVMRILDTQRGVKPLDQLGFSERNMNLVKEALNKPYGLILITGPTGSGKTTTLYSMLNALDRETSNVVSLEDPIEYNIPSLNQSQVMPEIGYTFASGLRSVLRQDPDIIMVGEIRDAETAQLAIQAALTGHLVFSTLHTNNAGGVVPRLIDMGVDPYLIAPTLILSIAQRLVRKACPSAKKEKPVDEATRKMMEKQFEDYPDDYKKDILNKDKMYEIVDTPDCPGGTRGRLAVFEMFDVDKEMQEVILKRPGEQDVYRVARKKGMMTMKEDTLIKALNGETSMTEVFGFN